MTLKSGIPRIENGHIAGDPQLFKLVEETGLWTAWILISFFLLVMMIVPVSGAVDVPVNVSEMNITNSSFMISWDGAINASSFNVQLSRNPSFGTYISNQNVATADYTFIGLQSATTYYYRINASDGSATSNFTSGQIATQTNAGDTGVYLGGLLSMNFEKLSNIIFFVFFQLLALVFYFMRLAIVSAFIVLLSGIILLFSGINLLIGGCMLILSVALVFRQFYQLE